MLVKYESENENQNVIRLKSIIVEANWKINAKFQHKPNATFVILLVWNVLLKGNQGEKQMLLPSMSWTALVTLPGTVIHYMLSFFLGSLCIILSPTHSTLWVHVAHPCYIISCCCCLVAKSCPTLCDPMDCSLPGSSVCRISQARILYWVAISSSGGSSPPRDQIPLSCISCTGRGILYDWATWEALYHFLYFSQT